MEISSGLQAEPSYISTGHLPSPENVQKLVDEAYERFKSDTSGQNSQVYPALASVPSDLFGICVVGTKGGVHAVGNAEHEFSIMSVSKPFVFALVCELMGPESARNKLGVNSTGLPFNSVAGVEFSADGRTNPMVNAGAIATTSLVPGETKEDKWEFIHDGLSRFAGRQLPLNEEVYASASETNFRNRSIARFLQSLDRIYSDPAEATDLYTRQCSLNVSAKDLAIMGATLADGGVNPVTRERVVSASVCHYALAVMATAGLYETFRRLALRNWAAGKERDRWRDRHRLTGQGRIGNVCAAARCGWKQRQRTVGRQISVAAPGNGSVCFAAAGLKLFFGAPLAMTMPYPDIRESVVFPTSWETSLWLSINSCPCGPQVMNLCLDAAHSATGQPCAGLRCTSIEPW